MVGSSGLCFQGWICIWRLARLERFGYVSSGGYDAYVWQLVERRLARAKAMDLPREYVDITSTVGRNLYFLSLWMRCVFYVVISLYPRPMMNQDRSL